jgi:hypothetical protein
MSIALVVLIRRAACRRLTFRVANPAVAAEFVGPSDRVLIVDDFLASGTTAVALLDIVRQGGATCVGFAFLIEKSFEGEGRAELTLISTSGRANSQLGALSVFGLRRWPIAGRVSGLEAEKEAAEANVRAQ